MIRWRAVCGVAAAALLAAAPGAHAHAFLDRADPRVGSTVKVSPARVKLWFTERLEPAYSTAQVLDEAGRQVDGRDVRVDDSSHSLELSLPALGPGRYRVIWRVLSVDTHVSSGDFTFRISP
ncbi:MAG TPA: copper resistance CopC family protein [Methylomirabilota bacterium]|nr:copper resistance CopC family protein [Methylomirabilota bacterium]